MGNTNDIIKGLMNQTCAIVVLVVGTTLLKGSQHCFKITKSTPHVHVLDDDHAVDYQHSLSDNT